MARTAGRRRRTGQQLPLDEPLDEEDQQEINDALTEEEKKRREELATAPMQAELKHLEKRWTKKGHGYIAEPKEDEDLPDDKINWYEKYALCVSPPATTKLVYSPSHSCRLRSLANTIAKTTTSSIPPSRSTPPHSRVFWETSLATATPANPI